MPPPPPGVSDSARDGVGPEPDADSPGAGTADEPVAALPPDLRDPFWPVGYAPRVEAPAEDTPEDAAPAPAAEAPREEKSGLRIDRLSEAQQEIVRRKLKVSGIMRIGAAYMARINNQLVGEGDEVGVELEGQNLAFLVRSITKDAVQLEPKR